MKQGLSCPARTQQELGLPLLPPSWRRMDTYHGAVVCAVDEQGNELARTFPSWIATPRGLFAQPLLRSS
jgi:hypothetical protein